MVFSCSALARRRAPFGRKRAAPLVLRCTGGGFQPRDALLNRQDKGHRVQHQLCRRFARRLALCFVHRLYRAEQHLHPRVAPVGRRKALQHIVKLVCHFAPPARTARFLLENGPAVFIKTRDMCVGFDTPTQPPWAASFGYRRASPAVYRGLLKSPICRRRDSPRPTPRTRARPDARCPCRRLTSGFRGRARPRPPVSAR